ncbi:hypothetical protein EBT25_08725, partial [bacterium]|nr:hypothetical protein [bacterium]
MSLIHDIALTFSPHWSPSIAREVAHRVHDRSHLFTASAEALEEWFPKHIQWRKSFLSWRTIRAPETYKKEIEESGVTCIARNDARYPPLLKE